MANDDRPKIWAQLPHEIYEYFFRKIFAGDRGIKQRLINQFFEALHNECKRQHIKAEWSPESGEAVREIMTNLTFHAHRSRRALNSPAQHQAQPPPSPDDGSATEGVCD